MSNLLNVAPSPHVSGSQSVRKIMYGVIIALLPAYIVSIFFFGMGAIVVTSTAVISCVVFEYLIQRFILKTQTTITDGSAVLTGLLLAFNVPSNLPIGIIIIGSFIAIGVGKLSFGGLGQNVFNPALVGRVFLLISFPVQMTSWPIPKGLTTGYVNALTGATVLGDLKEKIMEGDPIPELINELPADVLDAFLGTMGGSMGEISALALLIGFGFMLFRKIITWHIPVFIIGTVAVFTGILNLANPDQFAGPLFHIFTGGLMLGAIFMATDMVTSPMHPKGMFVFSVGIGIITVLIRLFGAYPEGISFAILIMNAFVPIINRYIKPKRFGEEVKHGK